MSDLITIPDTGMTDDEKAIVKKYISDGVPGITKVTEKQIMSAFELYAAGKSFVEIGQILKIKKEIVLYLAAKTKWHEKRTDHLTAIVNNFAEKNKIVKVETINTVSSLLMLFNKHYGKKVTESIIDGELALDDKDMKNLNAFYKSIEIMGKLLGENTSNKSPVNINVTGDATITTGPDKDVSDEELDTILKFLAKQAEQKDK